MIVHRKSERFNNLIKIILILKSFVVNNNTIVSIYRKKSVEFHKILPSDAPPLFTLLIGQRGCGERP